MVEDLTQGSVAQASATTLAASKVLCLEALRELNAPGCAPGGVLVSNRVSNASGIPDGKPRLAGIIIRVSGVRVPPPALDKALHVRRVLFSEARSYAGRSPRRFLQRSVQRSNADRNPYLAYAERSDGTSPSARRLRCPCQRHLLTRQLATFSGRVR